MSTSDSSTEDLPHGEKLEGFIRKIVCATIEQLAVETPSPFLSSQACAKLLDITPEHLCAMRARNNGPPWSGEGKWVRYERSSVLAWMRALPRHSTKPSPSDEAAGTDSRSESG